MLPFGPAVKVWRTHRGLTQSALALRARVPQPNLSAIERGDREVSLKTIRSLALALDVSPGTLVDGTAPAIESPWPRKRLERIARAAATGKTLTDPEDQSLVKALAQLAVSRGRAAGHPKVRGGRTRRSVERAWLAVSAGHPASRIQSLFTRLEEHRASRPDRS